MGIGTPVSGAGGVRCVVGNAEVDGEGPGSGFVTVRGGGVEPLAGRLRVPDGPGCTRAAAGCLTEASTGVEPTAWRWSHHHHAVSGGTTAKRPVLPGRLRAKFLDAPHGSLAACRTALASVGGIFEACFESRCCDHVVAGGARDQAAAQRQFVLACTIGEKAVVTNADEAIGQDVLQEATQKLPPHRVASSDAAGHQHSPGSGSAPSPRPKP